MSETTGRGVTTVSERTLTKIAEQVAADDDRLTARPRASASLSGGVATVHLDVSARYPVSVPRLAADVRRQVRDRVRELTGVTVGNVDIEIVRLMPAPRSGDDGRPSAS